ncbi:MAG: YdeI/OmpD-associated family protein [Sandaracinus sp.]|nr:YdeI/OmpD-associated family protein [Sandaracinus sp.]
MEHVPIVPVSSRRHNSRVIVRRSLRWLRERSLVDACRRSRALHRRRRSSPTRDLGYLRAVTTNEEIRGFASAAAFGRWLEKEHARSKGLWLKIPKKGSGQKGPSYAEALDEALRFGWIDGQKAKHDDDFFLQRFTPRTARSKWSKINRDKVAVLIAAGRMEAAGLAVIEAAKKDGRWAAAYDPPSKATVPDDLRAALDADPKAAAFFATLSSTNRFAILYRVQEAKRPETRARRIANFVAMCARGETIH